MRLDTALSLWYNRVMNTTCAPGRTPEQTFMLEHCVLTAVIGSQAYGLATPDSDTDIRRVFVAPPRRLFSLDGCPQEVDGPDGDAKAWEIHKFCRYALVCNPNYLEVLWSPQVRQISPIGAALIELRAGFLSRDAAGRAYMGFAKSELARMTRRRELQAGEISPRDWKTCMHALRVLISGIQLHREGAPMIDMTADLSLYRLLMGVRRGTLAWFEYDAVYARYLDEFTAAEQSSVLPSKPNTRLIESLLYDIRRMAILRDMREHHEDIPLMADNAMTMYVQ
jgi:uncharacterized protein